LNGSAAPARTAYAVPEGRIFDVTRIRHTLGTAAAMDIAPDSIFVSRPEYNSR